MGPIRAGIPQMRCLRVRSEDILICRLPAGPLMNDAAAWVRDRVRALILSGERRLILDMRAVTDLDGTGIGALVAIRAALDAGDLILSGPRAVVAQALRRSPHAACFDMTSDESVAIALLRNDDIRLAA